MQEELNVPFEACHTAEQVCRESNIIFTQNPGSLEVLKKEWLLGKGENSHSSGVTIISSGTDQPTKQELPNDFFPVSRYVSDLTKQTVKIGELRISKHAV